jgi:hypothetical protein
MMMEATSTSETSVNVTQTTQRNNPKGSHLQEQLLQKHEGGSKYSVDTQVDVNHGYCEYKIRNAWKQHK